MTQLHTAECASMARPLGHIAKGREKQRAEQDADTYNSNRDANAGGITVRKGKKVVSRKADAVVTS